MFYLQDIFFILIHACRHIEDAEIMGLKDLHNK